MKKDVFCVHECEQIELIILSFVKQPEVFTILIDGNWLEVYDLIQFNYFTQLVFAMYHLCQSIYVLLFKCGPSHWIKYQDSTV